MSKTIDILATQAVKKAEPIVDISVYGENANAISFKQYFEQFVNVLADQKIIVIRGDFTEAYYDKTERIMYLPDYTFVNELIAKMQSVHEVSHAMNSEREPIEFESKMFVVLFKIVEDIFVEKVIKNSFPGFVTMFDDAYALMASQGFFGDELTPDLDLVNKVNYFGKTGSKSIIEKSAVETAIMSYVRKNLNCTDDSVRKAAFLYRLLEIQEEKEQQQEQQADGGEGGNPPPQGSGSLLTEQDVSEAANTVENMSFEDLARKFMGNADSKKIADMADKFKDANEELKNSDKDNNPGRGKKVDPKTSKEDVFIIRGTPAYSDLYKQITK